MSSYRNLAQVREYVQLGVITCADIVREVGASGEWYLLFNGGYVLCTARGEPRRFASVDTALAVLERVGLRGNVLEVRA